MSSNRLQHLTSLVSRQSGDDFDRTLGEFFTPEWFFPYIEALASQLADRNHLPSHALKPCALYALAITASEWIMHITGTVSLDLDHLVNTWSTFSRLFDHLEIKKQELRILHAPAPDPSFSSPKGNENYSQDEMDDIIDMSSPELFHSPPSSQTPGHDFLSPQPDFSDDERSEATISMANSPNPRNTPRKSKNKKELAKQRSTARKQQNEEKRKQLLKRRQLRKQVQNRYESVFILENPDPNSPQPKRRRLD